MENNKEYYTPEISELFIGYQCQKESWDENGDDIWVDHTLDFSYGWCEIPEDYNTRLRTKYLTKEQILQEDWKLQADYGAGTTYIMGDMYRLDTVKHAGLTYKKTEIRIFKLGIFDYTERLYIGECKSINEFRKLVSWLNIK